MPRKRKSRDTRFSDYGSFFGMLSGGGKAKIKRDDTRDASDIAAGRDMEGDRSGDFDTPAYAERQAQVFLPKQSSFEAKLLGAGRAKFSPLGATDILKDVAGSDVASIWDSFENARTAHKATEHYHNDKIMKEFYGAVGNRPDPMSMSAEQAITGSNLRTEILRMAVDVPSPGAHHVIKKMRQKFDSQVHAAIASDDQEELIKLSADIADYLDMERPENYRKPPGKQPIDAGDILEKVKAKDAAKREEIKDAKATGDEVQDGNASKYAPGGKDAAKVMGRKHEFSSVEHVDSEPIQLGSAVNIVLDETRGLRDKQKDRFKGAPGRDIWRLGMMGDTAVFEENKKTRGKVAIMVDMSGSMGCPCASCDERRGRGWRNTQGKIVGDYRNAAWLAWQCAGAIMKAFPESDVYSYSSGRGSYCAASILTNTTGQQPTHASVGRYMGGSTPTCTGALFLKNVITSDIGASAAVLITDGYPNMEDCTAAVNKGFMRDGLRFASVLIGHDLRNMGKIFPSESSVRINDEASLPNLVQTMRFLSEVRQ